MSSWGRRECGSSQSRAGDLQETSSWRLLSGHKSFPSLDCVALIGVGWTINTRRTGTVSRIPLPQTTDYRAAWKRYGNARQQAWQRLAVSATLRRRRSTAKIAGKAITKETIFM